MIISEARANGDFCDIFWGDCA